MRIKLIGYNFVQITCKFILIFACGSKFVCSCLQIKESPLPILEPVDPVDREVTFIPGRAPYDPRWLVNGRSSPSAPGEWESGFFDKNSFQVCLMIFFFI